MYRRLALALHSFKTRKKSSRPGLSFFGKTGCTALDGLSLPGLRFFGKTGMFFVGSRLVPRLQGWRLAAGGWGRQVMVASGICPVRQMIIGALYCDCTGDYKDYSYLLVCYLLRYDKALSIECEPTIAPTAAACKRRR
jgi:hypothetical protein